MGCDLMLVCVDRAECFEGMFSDKAFCLGDLDAEEKLRKFQDWLYLKINCEAQKEYAVKGFRPDLVNLIDTRWTSGNGRLNIRIHWERKCDWPFIAEIMAKYDEMFGTRGLQRARLLDWLSSHIDQYIAKEAW